MLKMISKHKMLAPVAESLVKNQLNHSGYPITKIMKKLTTMTAPIVLELNLGQKKAYTVEPRSNAPAYKAMPAYNAFFENLLIIFCINFYEGYKTFSF